MGNLLTDRAKVLPLLAVMVVIAVGASLIILLTKPSGDSAGPTGGGGAATAQQSADGGAGKVVKIAIANFKYKPVTLAIKQGTKVAWTDEDSSNHTATSATGKGFDTGSINQGQTRSITFKKPGTYKYTCSFHPFMRGTIAVR